MGALALQPLPERPHSSVASSTHGGRAPPAPKGHLCEAVVTHSCGFISWESRKPIALPPTHSLQEAGGGSTPTHPTEPALGGVSRGVENREEGEDSGAGIREKAVWGQVSLCWRWVPHRCSPQ